MQRYTNFLNSQSTNGGRVAHAIVRASCPSGRSTSAFVVSEQGCTLMFRTQPRVRARSRAFVWGRGAK